MFTILRQSWAVAAMNIRGIPDRRWLSLSTVVALGLTVLVLLGFMALGSGIRTTLAGTGSDNVALVVRDGTPDESASTIAAGDLAAIAGAPQVARAGGTPVISPERFVIAKARRRNGGDEVNMSLRGIGPHGMAVRPQTQIAQGRMFARGTNEMIVGHALADQFEGFEVGKTVRIGTVNWKVVGIFRQAGSVAESEALVDVDVLQGIYNAGSSYQIARVLLTSPAALKPFKAGLVADRSHQIRAIGERAYFAKQAEGVATLLRMLAWPIAIAMAIGALTGALNTLYSSVAERRREIATLRAIGFSPVSAFLGTLAEAVALALAGALAAAALAAFVFNGWSTSTIGANFTQMIFSFRLTPADYVTAILLAMIVGLIGGFFPAWRAARTPLSAAQAD